METYCFCGIFFLFTVLYKSRKCAAVCADLLLIACVCVCVMVLRSFDPFSAAALIDQQFSLD